jgi:predicted secreted protein
MMMRKISFLVLLGLALVVFGCKSSYHIAQADPESDFFEIKKGQTFEIKFITNASTGYTWIWSNKKSVNTVDSVGDRFVNNAPAGVVGAGVNRYWAFRGVNKGLDTLQFEYCRVFQPNSAIKTRSVIVKVK